jgi:hypothetical protein
MTSSTGMAGREPNAINIPIGTHAANFAVCEV